MRIPILPIILLMSAVSHGQVIEAESGIFSGTYTTTTRPGYSGAGYVTGFDASGDKFSLTVNAVKGVYDLYVRYASPYGDKFNFVGINLQTLGSVAFPFSAEFTERKVGKVFLRDGSNSLDIGKDWGYFDVDYLRLAPSAAAEIYQVSPALVTPMPASKADSVYQLLSRLYGKVILSGQYGGEMELDYIRNISGRTPVIRGFDLMDYSPSRVERGATSTETEKAISWSKQRGMVTFAWHWNAPTHLIDQPGKEWWRGFYTEATTFDLAKAMNDTTSEEYTLIIRDIDSIAVQLKRLSQADVPVLWRPLHEAEGGWFWWGAKGPEPCKWLWKLLFKRLMTHHALKNLIWVWTSTGNPGAPAWYPGDEYVDIIGADIYLPPGSYSSHFTTFDNIASLYAGKKIIAMSENGPMPDPDRLFAESSAWSWFATWSGKFISDGTTNSASHVLAVYTHDYVITLDEISRIDEITALLEMKKEAAPDPVTALASTDEPILFFQNPVVNDRLVIQCNSLDAKMIICTLLGQTVFPENSTANGQSLEYDFSGKPAGVYLLKVIRSGSVHVYRVIKR